MSSSGKLRITGSPNRSIKEPSLTASGYIKASLSRLSIDRNAHRHDLHVQIVDLVRGSIGARAGVGSFFVAPYSHLRGKPVQTGLVVLGAVRIQIHRNIIPLRPLLTPLQWTMDDGAHRVLILLSNRRHMLEASPDALERVSPILYSEPQLQR